jgi:hypothetical protein
MKALGLVPAALLLAGSVIAQTATPVQTAPPETHGVSVVKARWQKYVHNPALDEDPLRAATEAWQFERDRREAQRTNAILSQQGRTQLPPPVKSANDSRGIPPNERRDYYLYEVKLSNTGTKKIRSLIWVYVLFDKTTQRQIGSQAFESKLGLGAGKSTSLTGVSTRPPVVAVDVSKSDRETKPGQHLERVEIHRVVYEDGTVWQRKY